MKNPLILAIDQGSSATKCLLVDSAGVIIARASTPVNERHPHPGWVEQDPIELMESVARATASCLASVEAGDVVAVGIANQRESIVLWERKSGAPLAPLVSWQDQRGVAVCDRLRGPDNEALVRARSGLPLDPMFSAAKCCALLDVADPKRERATRGELCLGTVDAWMLARFAGSRSEPVIEIGNAARTQLLDVRRGAWDEDLLALFDIPAAALPRIVGSNGPFPPARGLPPLGDGVPVHAVLGDSHAALFAHGARAPGQVKATYGTGSSVMGLLPGAEAAGSGICLSIAWQIGKLAYAAEGNIRASGATLRWLAQLLGMTPDALAELGAGAESEGVFLVPGFTGLGAPWWDRDAAGLIAGLRLDSGPAQLAAAALESIVHQVADVTDAMGGVATLFADGGPSRNDTLMQMQADILGCPVMRARDAELSALGAAHLAGLGAGVWDEAAVASLPRPRDSFTPRMDPAKRDATRTAWRRAVSRALA